MKSTPQNHGAALIITLAMIAMLTFLIVAFFSRTLTNLQVASASTGATRADVLAKSAGEIIVSDFKSEIIAGSKASGNVSQGFVYTPSTPATAVPAVSRYPFTSAGDLLTFVNLVKQSTGPFFPVTTPYNTNGTSAKPIIQAVTNITTDTLSYNGRAVVAKRWDNLSDSQTAPVGPMLLVSTSNPTFTRFYINAMLPHWIMMTRQGVPASQDWSVNGTAWKDYTPSNASAAIGRFSYNIYNVGGLLDVNAAGYDETSGSTTLTVNAVGQKGSLGLAKLSLIPKMDQTGTPESNASTFAKTWRNAASGGSANNYLAYLGFSNLGYLGVPKDSTTDLTTTPFFMAAPKAGFLKAAASTTAADNRILSRQDLIRIAAKTPNPAGSAPPYGLNVLSLPYLTHFSREVNAPSWYPPLDSSAMGGNTSYLYNTGKDSASATNRFFLNVRVAPGSNWRRLTGDAAVAGEPLVKYRFPLSWLAVLQDADPTTNTWDLTPEAIAIVNALNTRNLANGGPGLAGTTVNDRAAALVGRAFGLSWDSANHRWRYTGSLAAGDPMAPTLPYPKPTTAAGIELPIIELLGDATTGGTVCNESREPNFFELLKAGILSGSLGSASDFESMCVTAGEDAYPDNQIMQIGANMIDQADSDSYPTLIAFGYKRDNPSNIKGARSTASNPAPYLSTGEVKVIAGVEDVPYLNTVLCTPYRMPFNQAYLNPLIPWPDGAQNANRDALDSWAQFVLWKPQQQAVTTALPPKFRILYTVSTSNNTHLTYFPDNSLPLKPPFNGADFSTKGTDSSPPLTGGAYVTFVDTATDFRTPTLLGGMGVSSSHHFEASQPEGNGSNPKMPPGSAAQLPRGMWLGEMYRPEQTAMSSGMPDHKQAPLTTHIEFRCYQDSRLELQYDQDGSGNWRTYQLYNHFGVGTGGPSGYGGRSLYGYADNPVEAAKAGYPVGATAALPAYCTLDVAALGISAVDPRTQRYGLLAQYVAQGTGALAPQIVPKSPIDWRYFLKQGWAPIGPSNPYSMCFGPSDTSPSARFTPNYTGGPQDNPWASHTGDHPIPDATSFWADDSGTTNYYKDLDGVKRRADGDSTNSVRPIQLTYPGAAANTTALGRVLNRPFRSVGELSYVFRDEPYKSLNLFTDKSADSALLDIFSVSEQPAVVAGKVDLNTRIIDPATKNPAVLQAVIAGAAREELSSTNTLTASDATTIATALVADTNPDPTGTPAPGATTVAGPLMNPAEIAKRLATILPVTSAADHAIKAQREAVGRALAGSGQTRTWNFLVDLIAQSGRFVPSATSPAQFIVEGEKRYWLHLAIDRYTGQVVDQQWESVME